MRIGFLTNAYPFDKQSQISSFYQWVKEKQQEVIVIACFSDSYLYDKKSNVLSLPFKNLNDVMELGEFHFDLLQATFDDPLINLCKTQLKLPVFEKEILQCNFNDVFKKYQDAFLSINNILMVAPDVMIGASFLILFTTAKFQLGFVSVLASHVAFSIPIVVLMILPRLKEMNDDMIKAAYDLGASQVQMLKEIMLPYLTPAIIAGYFMAFTYSLDDFAVTFFVTGNGFSTLSVEIYSRARQGISLEINALSALVFLFSIVLVIGYYFITREKEEAA